MELMNKISRDKLFGSSRLIITRSNCYLRSVFYCYFKQSAADLDSRRIEHNTNGSTNSLRRQVSSKSGADGTVVTVMSHNFAPHDANVALLLVVAALVGSASTENEGNALAHVEFSVGLGVNTFELQQRNIVVLSGQAPNYQKKKWVLIIRPV